MSWLRAVIAAAVFTPVAAAADWPQWLGPNRDAVWPETGIVKEFPTGTMLIWETAEPPELKGPHKYDKKQGAVRVLLDGQHEDLSFGQQGFQSGNAFDAAVARRRLPRQDRRSIGRRTRDSDQGRQGPADGEAGASEGFGG